MVGYCPKRTITSVLNSRFLICRIKQLSTHQMATYLRNGENNLQSSPMMTNFIRNITTATKAWRNSLRKYMYQPFERNLTRKYFYAGCKTRLNAFYRSLFSALSSLWNGKNGSNAKHHESKKTEKRKKVWKWYINKITEFRPLKYLKKQSNLIQKLPFPQQ